MESGNLCDVPVRIDHVQLRAASKEDQSNGLTGWVSFTVSGALRVQGVALRRTRGGRRVLSFPARRDRNGHQHDFLRPLHDAARQAIERQVLAALGMDANLEA